MKHPRVILAATVAGILLCLWLGWAESRAPDADSRSEPPEPPHPASVPLEDGPHDASPGRLPAATDQAMSCKVLVIDADSGNPIIDARVLLGTPSELSSQSSSHAAFHTDGEGTCELNIPPTSTGLSIEVTAAGYGGCEEKVQPGIGPLTVKLHPLGHLSGIVVWRRDGLPVPGVQVVVFDSRSPPPSPADALLAPCTARFARTQSDPAGRFTLTGLDPSRWYSLIAGAPGVCTPRVLANLEVNSPGTTVEVVHAYGTMIQLRTSDTEAFDFPEAHRESIRYETSTGDQSFRPLLAFPAAAALAGVPVDILDLGPKAFVRLFGSDENPPRAGPHYISIHVPCYRDLDADFFSSRLDLGLEHAIFRLDKTCQGWGAVRLRPVGLSESMRSSLSTKPLLMNLDLNVGGERRDTFLFNLSTDESALVTDLPLASHCSRVYSRDKLFVHTFDESASVGELTASLDVDFSKTGLVKLEIIDRSGAESTEAVEVMLSSGLPELSENGKPRYRDARFLVSRPPDRLIGPVDAGTYTLVVPGQKSANRPSSAQERTVLVEAGVISTIRISRP